MTSFCVIGAQSQAARQGFILCVVSAFLISGIGSKMHKDQSQNLCNFLCKIRLHEIPIHDIIRGKLRETNTHTLEGVYKMAQKKMIMVIDTETANGIMVNDKLDLSCSLVYDIGFNVIDKKGNVYERRSLTIGDVFCGMKDLMDSAYYADKIPSYWAEIEAGKRELVSFFHAWEIVKDTLTKWNITTVSAHNARFDVNALNTTLRYLTKSQYRYFLPFGIEIWDTLKGANNTICKHKGYISFCKEYGYMTKHKTPRVRATAEILYRYLSGDYEFIEEHKGVNDTDIEAAILVQILRQHKKREFLQLYK